MIFTILPRLGGTACTKCLGVLPHNGLLYLDLQMILEPSQPTGN